MDDRDKGDKYGANRHWEALNAAYIGDPAAVELESFRRGRVNAKISTWDFRTDGVRYLKTLLFNEALRFSARHWALLDSISERTLGNPVRVRVQGRAIDFDYLLAVQELFFLDEVLGGSRSVLEIGAGFGRTAHAVLSAFPEIERYTIIDLAGCLGLSRRYLEAVLPPAAFRKIAFLSNEDAEKAVGPFDLAINIDSMMEMRPEVVDCYLVLIAAKAGRFYCKNTVGKFHPSELEQDSYDEALVASAMASGKLPQRIKMFDSEDLETHVPAFLDAFRPAAGWQVVRQGWALPLTYYYQAVYEKG